MNILERVSLIPTSEATICQSGHIDKPRPILTFVEKARIRATPGFEKKIIVQTRNSSNHQMSDEVRMLEIG